MFQWLNPQDKLSVKDVRRGLAMVLLNATFYQVMVVLSLGLFLTAYVLQFTDRNIVLGLVSGAAALSTMFQVFGAILTEKIRKRKAIVCIVGGLSRLSLLLVPVLPLILPHGSVIPVLIAVIFVFYLLGNLVGPAWGSWVRDLIPERVMAKFVARRQMALVAVGAVLGLPAALFADYYKKNGNNELVGYSLIILTGALVGLIGFIVIFRIPEPRMNQAPRNFRKMMMEPLHDANYRRWLVFTAVWTFGLMMLVPFLSVHLMTRLKLSMTRILGLSLISQLIMAGLSPVMAKLVKRFTSKTILSASLRLLFFTFLLWAFTLTAQSTVYLFLPLIFTIYILGGIAWSGIGVSMALIGMKITPKGRAAAYFATGALINGVVAAIAPVIGGYLADVFRNVTFKVPVSLFYDGMEVFSVPALSFSGIDFVMLFACLIGLYAIQQLRKVKEPKELRETMEKDVWSFIYVEMRKAVRQVAYRVGNRNETFVAAYSSNRASRVAVVEDTGAETEMGTDAVPDDARSSEDPARESRRENAPPELEAVSSNSGAPLEPVPLDEKEQNVVIDISGLKDGIRNPPPEDAFSDLDDDDRDDDPGGDESAGDEILPNSIK